jgi:hypothetical protein
LLLHHLTGRGPPTSKANHNPAEGRKHALRFSSSRGKRGPEEERRRLLADDPRRIAGFTSAVVGETTPFSLDIPEGFRLRRHLGELVAAPAR